MFPTVTKAPMVVLIAMFISITTVSSYLGYHGYLYCKDSLVNFENEKVCLHRHQMILDSKTGGAMNHQTILQIPHSHHQKELGNHPTGYHCSYHISLSAEIVKYNFKLILT
jgi:hypothetical protein